MSGTTNEVELKYSLECKASPLERLVALVGPQVGELRQWNHYFTNGKKPMGTVRLRKELSAGAPGALPRWVLTMKGKRLEGVEGLFIREELEADVTVGWGDLESPTQRLELLARHPLLARSPGPWRWLGVLENRRFLLDSGDGVWELDQSNYPHLQEPVWELEIECEAPSLVAPRVEEVLRRANIAWHPSRKGKFARFTEGLV